MKNFLLILFFVSSIFASDREFLTPDEAFKYSYEQADDKLILNLKLGKDIYLYDEQLKVFITKPQEIDISKDLNIQEPVEYDGFIVHFDEQNIEIPFSLLKSKIESNSYEILFNYQGCSKAGLCYAPMSQTVALDLPVVSKGESSQKTVESSDTSSVQDDSNLNETDLIAKNIMSGSMLLTLATFFGFGLLLSLTPCIFPMIPILSSIIVKAGQSKELTAKSGFLLSLVYVLSMAMAYTIAGVIAGLFGANLQAALQNPYVLVTFAAIFVALAFSMFGYYSLELPQSIQNKITKTSEGQEKHGILGVAIMGFLSALIVGPCVAPPLAGALIYIGQTGDALLGGLALFVMSIGMGIPLLLIGLGAGKFMPHPGGWMESVTRIFGIVMLGIAIWMLDRVIEPIYTMYLWAFLLIGAGIYLRMYNHILIKLLTTILFIYGVLVFVGAVSGAKNVLKPLEQLTSKTSSNQVQGQLTFTKVKNIQELEVALQASNKPVMLDFYADWCVACKELEEITFKDERVIAKLSEFTLLKADVTKNTQEDKDIQKKFGVVGPPVLVFWDTNKQEIQGAKIVGFKDADNFLEIVNRFF